ncbi:MAG: hypothetical protein ACLQBY_12485 [Solirubrobacteraceae bacterium]
MWVFIGFAVFFLLTSAFLHVVARPAERRRKEDERPYEHDIG